MKSKDQILLEGIYSKLRKPDISKESKKQYDNLVDRFGEKLYDIFGETPFTKKTILAHKNRFEEIDKEYQTLFNTEYSLFSFEDTQERLSNMLSRIGVRRPDMKFESGPKGMIYWFEHN